MNRSPWAHWQANFFAGLAVVLPAVVSIALIVWLFGTVARITDTLLFFLPREWTHKDYGQSGDVHWYWSVVALLVAIVLTTLAGRAARHYFGRKVIELVDLVLLRVPLLNKIYGSLKQVNDAFTSSSKSSFKQVVLVQFPRPGIYSVGFITSEHQQEVQAKTGEKMVGVFVPTTPNPTSGFIVMVPEPELVRLEMSVADGIKFIMSLGAIAPEYRPPTGNAPAEIKAQPVADLALGR